MSLIKTHKDFNKFLKNHYNQTKLKEFNFYYLLNKKWSKDKIYYFFWLNGILMKMLNIYPKDFE